MATVLDNQRVRVNRMYLPLVMTASGWSHHRHPALDTTVLVEPVLHETQVSRLLWRALPLWRVLAHGSATVVKEYQPLLRKARGFCARRSRCHVSADRGLPIMS